MPSHIPYDSLRPGDLLTRRTETFRPSRSPFRQGNLVVLFDLNTVITPKTPSNGPTLAFTTPNGGTIHELTQTMYEDPKNGFSFHARPDRQITEGSICRYMEHSYSTSIDTIVLINSITPKNERHTFYIATEIHTGRMFRCSSYVTETKLYRATREDINELTPLLAADVRDEIRNLQAQLDQAKDSDLRLDQMLSAVKHSADGTTGLLMPSQDADDKNAPRIMQNATFLTTAQTQPTCG